MLLIKGLVFGLLAIVLAFMAGNALAHLNNAALLLYMIASPALLLSALNYAFEAGRDVGIREK